MHDAQAGARQCAAQDVSLGHRRHEKDQQWQLRMQDCILRKPRTQVFQRRSCLLYAYEPTLTMHTTLGLRACHMVQQIMYKVTSAGPLTHHLYFECHLKCKW